MTKPATPLMEAGLFSKFWACVQKTGTCWVWLGQKNSKGYGRFLIDGRRVGAHRVAYSLLVGPIQNKLTLDHLCRNRACVNPEHLEQVTSVENVMRGEGFAPKNAKKTHCPFGHAYTAENTMLSKSGRGHVTRVCRTCRRIRNLAFYAANREEEKQRAKRRYYRLRDLEAK